MFTVLVCPWSFAIYSGDKTMWNVTSTVVGRHTIFIRTNNLLESAKYYSIPRPKLVTQASEYVVRGCESVLNDFLNL